ncbi:MAG TPA: mercury resistance system periplasmic binding protein MerP [Burkholderiales bacterium]|nr:mercury resistance system periplasmic binding protein MerP [Burkholderiales bacterium]
MKKLLLTCALAMMLVPSVRAASKTVTLSIPSMNCPACPITVKKALTKVPGVSKAKVDFDTREASVTFDDTRTTVGALMQATKQAGYPSMLAGNTK